jgi:hypothetical protein
MGRRHCTQLPTEHSRAPLSQHRRPTRWSQRGLAKRASGRAEPGRVRLGTRNGADASTAVSAPRFAITPAARLGTVDNPSWGGTLVEVLASTLVMSILAAMAYGFARSALVSVRVLDTRSEAQEVAVMAVDVLTRELRLAGFSGAGELRPGVTVAEAERVEVVADLNGDGDTNDAHEQITYLYDAATRLLMRGTGGGSPQPFVADVPAGGLRFTYYDATGGEIVPGVAGLSVAERRRIQSIGIRLMVEVRNPEPRAQAPIVVTLSETVALRNPLPVS